MVVARCTNHVRKVYVSYCDFKFPCLVSSLRHLEATQSMLLQVTSTTIRRFSTPITDLSPRRIISTLHTACFNLNLSFHAHPSLTANLGFRHSSTKHKRKPRTLAIVAIWRKLNTRALFFQSLSYSTCRGYVSNCGSWDETPHTQFRTPHPEPTQLLKFEKFTQKLCLDI